MPKKFTDLAELTAPDKADLLAVVDVSANTSKKISIETLASLLTPAGIITPYAGSSAPTGWLICDGSAVSRATYSRLFTAIGTNYGTGDGTTTFNLPNLKGKVPVGLDTAQTEFDTIGESGGAKTHTLTSAEMPSHTHGIGSLWLHGNAGALDSNATNLDDFPGSNGPIKATNVPIGNSWSGSLANTGGGGAHNNLQPYVTTNYLIKV